MDHYHEKIRKGGADFSQIGKSKVSWSGIEKNENSPSAFTQPFEPFDWKLAKKEIEGEDVLLSPSPNDLQLNEADRELLGRLVDLLKEGKEEEVQDEVHKLFGGGEDPREQILTLATNSPDFREGRAKGVTGTLIKALQKHNFSPPLPNLPFNVMDYVFFKFFQQPNAATLIAAFLCFDLINHKLRYSRVIVDLASDGDYKGACHAAVALCLWDFFPIEIFCLPLLLQDKLSVMESYLASSPIACGKMIRYLDGFHVENEDKVTALCSLYPKIRPIGASKLSKKPLDKLIRRYATAWGLPPSYYPLSVARRAAVDLSYWVRQKYISGGHSLSLVNWRELLETKVGENKEMQGHLVGELMKHDTGEALHWNNIFQLNLFPHNAASTTAPHLLNPWIPVLENNFTGAEEYYQLHFSDDQVIFVDNSEKFDMFLGDVGSQRQVGVDAEFMSSSSEQKISLLQVTQLCFSFSTLFLSSIRLLPKVVHICLTLRVFPLH